jgi:hypothetical protein
VITIKLSLGDVLLLQEALHVTAGCHLKQARRLALQRNAREHELTAAAMRRLSDRLLTEARPVEPIDHMIPREALV